MDPMELDTQRYVCDEVTVQKSLYWRLNDVDYIVTEVVIKVVTVQRSDFQNRSVNLIIDVFHQVIVGHKDIIFL